MSPGLDASPSGLGLVGATQSYPQGATLGVIGDPQSYPQGVSLGLTGETCTGRRPESLGLTGEKSRAHRWKVWGSPMRPHQVLPTTTNQTRVAEYPTHLTTARPGVWNS